jgi:hypothetical protein
MIYSCHIYKMMIVFVIWFLIVVQEASSAMQGGSNHHNGRISSRNMGPKNRTRDTSLKPLPNILFALLKQRDIVQQGGSPSSSLSHRKRRTTTTTALQVAEISSDDEKNDVVVDLSKLGHDRLGEVLYGKFGESINSITGKNKSDPYQFGDLTKWVDRQARMRVGGLLPKNNETASQAERNENRNQQDHKKSWIDTNPFRELYAKFGKRVNSITGKKDPYEFGDLTKWLETEVRSQKNMRREEEDDEDHGQVSHFLHMSVLAFRFLRSSALITGIRLTVKLGIERLVLSRLPSVILLELVHLILDGNYRALILRVVATELDKRIKMAISGDEDYQLGDLTKKALFKYTGKEQYQFGDVTKTAITKYTGKEQYEFGDVTKKALTKFTGKKQYEFGDITKVILERAQASEEATARYKDQVQKELRFLEDDVRSRSAGSKRPLPPPSRQRGIRITTLRWFQN